MTPNQLTTLRLATGIAAAAAFAIGSDGWRDVGGVLFIVSMVLDRADGELARLTGTSSPWGHQYDLVADTVCHALIFIGLGIGLRAGEFGLWALPIGVLAGAAIAAVLLIVMRLEALGGERAGEISSFAGFDPDDSLVVVPLCVWFGFSEALLVAAAIGAPLAAILMYAKFRSQLRAG